MSLLDQWIAWCADPLGSRLPMPRKLPPQLASRLVDQAEKHGVLGAVLLNFRGFGEAGQFASSFETARDRNRRNVAFSRLLAHEAASLCGRFDGLRATVVKGPTFSQKLYPSISLRPFSDVDVLVDPRDQARLEGILSGLGYELVEKHEHESKWRNRENPQIMVEVQTDLVHATSLRYGMSLSYDMIARSVDSPASLLIIALVHGAAHQYDRLQHLVDICQAARRLESTDAADLETLLAATNARFAAAAGLLLAGRIFGEPRCNLIANEIGFSRVHGLASLILNKTVVLSTMDERRPIHNWRRLAFRALLRQGRR